MSQQKKLGNKGEKIAQAHLRALGYEILKTNWRWNHYEIDLIAIDQNELVIVEVKARTGTKSEHLSEAISSQKIRFLVNAAEAYIQENNSQLDTRFDVIYILFKDSDFELEHIQNAFYPTF